MAGPNFGPLWYSSTPAPANPTAVVGTSPPDVWWRSVLDARRMMHKRVPEAEYPSGYLGTIVTRQQDKVLDSLKARVNQRSYQRGVHLGERIDPGEYLWPEEQNPMRGLVAEATTGERYAPALKWWEPKPSVDTQLAPRGSESILTIDQHRMSQLKMLQPKWGFPAGTSR